MKLLAFDQEPFKGNFPKSTRKLAVQIYFLQPNAKKLPIILFSGGFGENYRFYSTILKNLSNKGYIIVNIDHYYYQDTLIHPKKFDIQITGTKSDFEKETDSKKREKLFMKAKAKTLDIYYKDIIYVLSHLHEILTGYDQADFSNIILMGHSLGGNAGKKILENNKNNNIKALIALDSRFNQLGLKTKFELPTLLIGAGKHYQTPDPMRQLPKQPNLKLKIMEHATHVSFDDISIFALLGKDLNILKEGLNEADTLELEENIAEILQGHKVRFNEELFLGNKEQMQEFLDSLNNEVDEFIKAKIK